MAGEQLSDGLAHDSPSSGPGDRLLGSRRCAPSIAAPSISRSREDALPLVPEWSIPV